MKLKRLEDKVKEILESDERTREDDMYLYYIYLMCEGISKYDMSEALRSKRFRRVNKLSTMESVGRCRRKIQEKNESLRASEEAKKYRALEESLYEEYARS